MSIEDKITDLIARYKEDSRLERKINSETTPAQRNDLRAMRDANQKDMERLAVALLVGVLTDFHRIADALEVMSKSEGK